jgi:hypothetical protein
MLLYGPYIDFIAVGFGLIAVLARSIIASAPAADSSLTSPSETGAQFIAPRSSIVL